MCRQCTGAFDALASCCRCFQASDVTRGVLEAASSVITPNSTRESTVLCPSDRGSRLFHPFESTPQHQSLFSYCRFKSPPLVRLLHRSAFLLSFIFLRQPPPPPCLEGRKPLSCSKISSVLPLPPLVGKVKPVSQCLEFHSRQRM